MGFRTAPMSSAAAAEAVDRDNLFTPETPAEIETWCAKYPAEWRQSAVIPALHILQDANGGWLAQQQLDDLAAYTLVTLIIMAMTMISRALFQALLPEISRPFASRDYRRGTRIINFAMVGSIIMLVAVYVGLFVVLFVFNLPLPVKYSPTPLLLIMAGTANLCDALFIRGAWILTRLKKTGVMAIATTLSAAATISLSFLLVRALGDLGLVIAVAGGFGILAAVSNAAAWWQLRIAFDSKAT